MKRVKVYYSPVICYEIIKSDSQNYSIDCYIEGKTGAGDPNSRCVLEDFSNDMETAEAFTKLLAENGAFPIHVPELAENFLSDI
ncbi:MAG: DUF6514 family protein [Ruminococcus sp.]